MNCRLRWCNDVVDELVEDESQVVGLPRFPKLAPGSTAPPQLWLDLFLAASPNLYQESDAESGAPKRQNPSNLFVFYFWSTRRTPGLVLMPISGFDFISSCFRQSFL